MINNNEKLKQDFILLGLHIKKLREERNLTIKDVALKTGIRVQYLRKIENGTAYGVRIEGHLYKISKAFSINFVEIFKFK